jgi:outer membrane protein assembly factor BamB
VRLRLAFLTAVLGLGGCGLFGGGDDNVEPPAELQPIEATLEVDRLWRGKVGKGAERLRLGLRPASDGARIYAASHDGRVAAFDPQTGRRQWLFETDMPLAAGPAFGSGLLVVGSTDGDLLALEAATGEERWRISVGSEVLAPPAVGTNVVVYRTVDGRLRGVAAADGSALWAVQQSPPPLTVRGNTAPYMAGQTVVCGFDNGRVGAYEITTGAPVWEFALANPSGRNELERLVDVSAGIQVVGNDVYTAGYQGRAMAIDLNNGLPLWQQEMSSFTGLGADVENVYVVNDVDAVVALARNSGVPVWRQEALRLRDLTAPVRHERTLVVGDFEGYLHWLDPNSGEFIARVRAAQDRITTTPLVVGRNVYVQSDDGTISAYTLAEDDG